MWVPHLKIKQIPTLPQHSLSPPLFLILFLPPEQSNPSPYTLYSSCSRLRLLHVLSKYFNSCSHGIIHASTIANSLHFSTIHIISYIVLPPISQLYPYLISSSKAQTKPKSLPFQFPHFSTYIILIIYGSVSVVEFQRHTLAFLFIISSSPFYFFPFDHKTQL